MAIAHILLMEDDPEQASLLREGLERVGHSVEIANSASEAWALCNQPEVTFDIVVTDILVRRDGQVVSDGGVSLIGKLRNCVDDELRWVRGIPIVAISGAPNISSSISYLDLAEVLGANVVLNKPTSLGTLTGAIAKLLAAR